MQDVVDDDRSHGVQLEVALGAGGGDDRVLAHDLKAHHDHGFLLGRVDLAGHDRRAGLVGGQSELVKAGPGTGSQPAHVVGDLHERNRDASQSGADGHHGVQRALGGELVRGGPERKPGQLGQLFGHCLTEALGGVEARSHRRPTDGELFGRLERTVEPTRGVPELRHPSGPLLSDGERGRVLEVGAPDLDHVDPFHRFGPQGVGELTEPGKRVLSDGDEGGDVHGRGEGVVGRLAHVHVVVGVDRRLGAQRAAEQLTDARLAMTSLTFMFDWVPDPVCQT